MTAKRIFQSPLFSSSSLPPMLRDALIGILIGTIILLIWLGVSALQPRGKLGASAQHRTAVLDLDRLEASSGPTGAPLLWRAKTTTGTVYLFGSIHVLRSDLDWMDPRLFSAYDNADQAWFEVPDLDKLPPFKGFNTPTTSTKPVLLSALTTVEQNELAKIINRYDLTLDDVKHLEPAAMAGFVEDLDLFGNGFSSESGVDFTLYHRAVAMKKPTNGFESFSDHYRFLTRLGPDRGEQGTLRLKQVLAAHFGNGAPSDDLNVLQKYWQTGDEKALTDSLLAEKAQSPKTYSILLVERNHNWMPVIRTMLASGKTTFITVGVDHLIGPDGLVAQLRRSGLKVERVDP